MNKAISCEKQFRWFLLTRTYHCHLRTLNDVEYISLGNMASRLEVEHQTWQLLVDSAYIDIKDVDDILLRRGE